MKQLVKVLWFILACCAILATIGGTGYLFYYGKPLFASSVLIFSLFGCKYLGKGLKGVLYE